MTVNSNIRSEQVHWQFKRVTELRPSPCQRLRVIESRSCKYSAPDLLTGVEDNPKAFGHTKTNLSGLGRSQCSGIWGCVWGVAGRGKAKSQPKVLSLILSYHESGNLSIHTRELNAIGKKGKSDKRLSCRVVPSCIP
jgi:hypothetical protein